MGLTFGLYDFFAYTIPGAFYLMIAAYAASIFGIVTVDLAAINDVSFFSALVLAGVAFVVGLVMDPLTAPWSKRFRPSNPAQHGYDAFMADHRSWEANFSASDWRLMGKSVRLASRELMEHTDRHNVMNILLRNIGFGLLLLSALYIVYFFLVTANVWNLVLAAVCLALSIVAERQSAKFSRWYYEGIFQAGAALSLGSHIWVQPKSTSEAISSLKPIALAEESIDQSTGLEPKLNGLHEGDKP